MRLNQKSREQALDDLGAPDRLTEIVAAETYRSKTRPTMILESHDSAWAEEFASLREVYINALGPLILRVEHVGSTAVPNLLAKPILDIDIVMPGYDVFSDVMAALGVLGYTHHGDQEIEGRETFKRHDRETPFTLPRRTWMEHHLYVCPANGAELRRHLRFRDMLLAHTVIRHEYEQLKIEIAVRSAGDRKTYARLKEIECRAFFGRILSESIAID